MEFDLNKNAINFINESIHCAKRAAIQNNVYPFAIINLTQALELTLKALLTLENKMLIYDDIDKPNLNKTVSITTALNRLVTFEIINLDSSDKVKIERAVKYRNQIIHHQFQLNPGLAYNYFLRLFEFLHYFYSKYLNKDLHDVIQKEHWSFEAILLSQIKRSDFVHYHGITVHKTHPTDIVEAQYYNAIKIGRKIYDRVKFGDETSFKIGDFEICNDCGVIKGFYHTDFCDHEQCPKCGEQLIGFHECDVKGFTQR